MALYFLSYDLRNSRNYETLYAELSRLGGKRALASLWFLDHNNTTASALRDHFKQFIDHDDGLVVIAANGWATLRAQSTPDGNSTLLTG